jgi:hypothetical protein
LSREDIFKMAREKIGSKEWSKAARIDNFRAGDWKCNKFVADILGASGAPVPLPHHPVLRFWSKDRYPPTAGDWGNPDFDIPGWKVVDGPPQKGDIVAFPHGFQDPTGLTNVVGNATGHVGIATGTDSYISAKEHEVVDEPFSQVAPGTRMVIRRYENLSAPLDKVGGDG